MKPIVNYGLSDSLIDAVRKSVEEARGLVGDQPKLDTDHDNDIDAKDLAALRARRRDKKDFVNTKPKLKEEEEQIDELSNKLYFAAYKRAAQRSGSKAVERDGGIKAKHFNTLELGYKGVKRNNAKKMNQQAEDIEQMDEASAQDIVARLKKKHKDGNYSVGPGGEVTHPYLEKDSVDRRIAALKKEDEQMNEAHTHRVTVSYDGNSTNPRARGIVRVTADNHKEAKEKALIVMKRKKNVEVHSSKSVNSSIEHNFKEEYEQMDEAMYDKDHAQRIVNRLKDGGDGNYSVGPENNGKHPVIHAYHPNSRVNRDIKMKNVEDEQMDEANSDNPEYEGRLAAIDMYHYKEVDHHRRTLQTLGTQGKLNTPKGKFHKAALEKHQAALNAMASSDHESMRKKLKMRSLKREDVEQMDEVSDQTAHSLLSKRTRSVFSTIDTANRNDGKTAGQQSKDDAAVNIAKAKRDKAFSLADSRKNRLNPTREEYEQMDEAMCRSRDAAQSIVDRLKKKHKDGNYSVGPDGNGHGVVHPYLTRDSVNRRIAALKEEDEQMNEVNVKDLPVRFVPGRPGQYDGANYVDPEGADDADDMKNAGKKPKSKSGPHKRRFDTISYRRIKGQLNQQAK